MLDKNGADMTGAGHLDQRLYHCMNREPQGDALEPTCERAVNGRVDKFLFATPYISKAMVFSFDYHDKGEIIMNGSLDGTRDEFAIICDRDQTLSRPRHIQIFAFSGEGFESLGEGTRQSVSTRPVPFAATDCLFLSEDVEDTMRYGLQIFSTDKTRDQLLAEDFTRNFCLYGDSWAENLYHLIQDQGFRWENQARHLNPTPQLEECFRELSQRRNAPSFSVKPSL